MRTHCTSTSLVGLLAVVCVGSTSWAATAPTLRCQTAKLIAVGAEVRSRLMCERRALAGKDATACTSGAALRRDTAFARDDASGMCGTVGDSEILGNAVEAFIDAVLDQLVPGGPGPSRCTGQEFGATARDIAKLALAHLRDARRPDPARFASDVASARAELVSSFVRAAQQGDCLSPATAAGVADLAEEAATTFRGMLLDACPCWTTSQIDAAFPSGFFDAAGRGGVVCNAPGTSASMGAADSCLLPGPLGQTTTLPRGGAGVISGSVCTLLPDLDPSNTGTCTGAPTVRAVTARESAACTARLLASSAYQGLCL